MTGRARRAGAQRASAKRGRAQSLVQRLAGGIARGLEGVGAALRHVGQDVKDLQAGESTLRPSDEATEAEREGQCVLLREAWQASADPMHQQCAQVMSRCQPGGVWVVRRPIARKTMWMWSVGASVPKVMSAGSMAVTMQRCGSCSKVRRCCWRLTRLDTMMAR